MAGLAAALVLCVPAQAMAGIACKPVLQGGQVFGSTEPIAESTGVLAVDASHCVATSGPFEEVRPDKRNGGSWALMASPRRSKITRIRLRYSRYIITLFAFIHKTLRVTPATAANVSMRLWEMSGIVDVLEAWEEGAKQ